MSVDTKVEAPSLEDVVDNVPKKDKKKKKWPIIVLAIVATAFLAVAVVLLLMFINKPKFVVKVNAGGGRITRDAVVKDDRLKDLPEIEPPAGKTLVTWVTEEREAVRPGLLLTGDLTLDPVFDDIDRETVTLHFDSGTDEIIPDVVIKKGTEVILPVKPEHSEWEFLYWVDKDGFIVLKNRIIWEDATFTAYWRKPDPSREEVTIKFETKTDEKIDDIRLVKGSDLIFPTPKTEIDDMVFRGWLDENGQLVTNEQKADRDMVLTANWLPPYSCPENCTPDGDGSTCTSVTVVEPSSQLICQGMEWRGYCLDFSQKESDMIRQCAAMGNDLSDEVWYQNANPDGSGWCVKKMPRVRQFTCPEGYTREGDNCRLEEKKQCTEN